MMLVGSLGLVLMLIARAADPDTWNWIVPPEKSAAETSDAKSGQITRDDVKVPRRAVAADSGIEGEFRIAATKRPATPYTLGEKGRDQEEKHPGEASPETWATPEALSAVEDNSPFRASGFEAWKQIHERLEEESLSQIQSEEAPSVQFGQLFQQSDLYRGKLVTVSGTVRRCVKIPPNKLDDHAGDMWQLWLFGGSDNFPMVIYCLDLPEGFPVADQMAQKVTIRAVYFKKWVHPSKSGATTSPLLLAKTFAWTSSASVVQEVSTSEIMLGITLTLVGACVIVGFIWWNNRNRDSEVERRVRQGNRKQFESHRDELNVGTSVRDQLVALSEQLKQTSSTPKSDDDAPK